MKKIKWIILVVILVTGILFVIKNKQELLSKKIIVENTKDIICCQGTYLGDNKIISTEYSHKSYCGGENNSERYMSKIVEESFCKNKYEKRCKNISEHDAIKLTLEAFKDKPMAVNDLSCRNKGWELKLGDTTSMWTLTHWSGTARVSSNMSVKLIHEWVGTF